MMSRPLLGLALCLPVAWLLGGCTTLYPTPQVQFPTAAAHTLSADGVPATPLLQPVAMAPAPAPVVNGSIYQAASYRPLFEDHRARLVGDTLTVTIAERVSATQKATSTLDKGGSLSGSVTSLPFLGSSAFGKATAGGSSSNTFAGKGTTESSNDFAGTITANVVAVLPNGHLLIAGEKQVGLNQHVDVLRFTGQVDPRSIQPGNTVQSAQIANVRVESKGQGAMQDAQGIGWLGRFFLNLMPI
jgi:flagellar L-ring protein FlgH